MARVSGRDAHVKILDSTSASRLISGRSNSWTLSMTAEELDVTAFGAGWRERVGDALKDWSFEVSGFYDGAGSQVDEILQGILGACTSLCLGPSGSTSGAIQYVGSAILQEYSIEPSVDAPVPFSATFQGAVQLIRTTFS